MSQEFMDYLSIVMRGLDEHGRELLGGRGILADAAKRLGISNDGDLIIYTYRRNGIPERFKIRNFSDKKVQFFSSKSPQLEDEEDYKLPFFNQQHFKDRSYLVVTEGEFDAVAVAQLGFENVVSLPAGAGSAGKVFREELKYLLQFDEIFICFDMDDAGNKAADEVATIIPPHKYRRIHLLKKDMNDVILDDENFSMADFERLMANAERVKRDTVVHAGDCDDDEIFMVLNRGMESGFLGLDEVLGGLRPGEITSVTGDTGSGKTTICLNIIYYLSNQNIPCWVTSHEMRWQILLQKMGSLVLRKAIREVPVLEEERESFLKWRQEHSLYLNPHGAEITLDSLCADIEFACVGRGVKIVMIEDLGYLGGTGKFQTERENIEQAMKVLRAISHQFSVHILLIVHPKQTKDDKGFISMAEMKGSSGIKQYSDNVLIVQRLDRTFPERVEMKDVVKVRVAKNRALGKEDNIYLRYFSSYDGYQHLESLPGSSYGKVI